MLVSESYVILYCEKNVICNSSIKICLNQVFNTNKSKFTSWFVNIKFNKTTFWQTNDLRWTATL